MSGNPERLRDWLGGEVVRILRALPLAPSVEHIGRVTRVGDTIATIAGLPLTRLGELLAFADGSVGLALSVDQDSVDCVLLESGKGVATGTKVRGTGEVVRVPVGEPLLGRVVDVLGRPLDGGPSIEVERHDPIERPAPGILERDLITEPLMTGLTVVDAMIPLGRGQRTLLLGDRKTGKTALAVDTVINQRESDVICVYALIGQKSSAIQQVVDAITQHGPKDRTIIVVGEAGAAPGAQWLVPYAACTMAEYFRDKGQHVLLILDDLSKHANVYRELSLLLRRPPGREAYPGDIFYVHSRLLERAAKLSPEHGGGSLTALPIVETQAGNLSAYIPTNLISITDGQVYFEPKLFYEGQKPAVNVGLSVSRVGAKSQAPALKKAVGRLKLDYAQFVELEVFTRFGAMLDERTSKRIAHGRRIRAILAQPQLAPRSLATQAALLLAVTEGRLDDLGEAQLAQFKAELPDELGRQIPQTVARLERDRRLTDDIHRDLLAALDVLIGRLTDADKARGAADHE
ncbi:MAG: F0F1 ATP synthase subunit alpha [Hyphomicrobiaceae bacterium]